MKMKELHPSVRPYERLESSGAEALSDEELLAIIIRTGTKGRSAKEIASQILSSENTPDGLSGLNQLSISELSDIDGVGRIKAIMIKASLELGKRSVTAFSNDNRVRFLSEDIACRYFQEKMSWLDTEEVQVVYLDTQKRLIAHHVLCKGTLNSVGVSNREVFRIAVKVNAAALILAHNHPSGDAKPSEEDIQATKELQKSGQLIGIDVIDHIVVGRGVSISMLKNGYMEEI
ncbi:MAG: DNA repair protein RadC [Clostridiales bacterium]|nr:DNA repair protein RadC [Clostridiales bacterium]